MRLSIVLLFPMATAAWISAQTDVPQEATGKVIRSTSREVLLDLVVRDKHPDHPAGW